MYLFAQDRPSREHGLRDVCCCRLSLPLSTPPPECPCNNCLKNRSSAAQTRSNECSAHRGIPMNIVARTAITVLSLVLLMTGMLIPDSSVLTPLVKAQSQPESAQANHPFVPGRVLVKFRSETTGSRSQRIINRSGASDAGEISGIGVHIVQLPAAADESAFVNVFKSQPELEFAELDLRVAPDVMTPNDPQYGSEWHLPKIAGPSAWAMTTGTSNVIIAILDTGCDPSHPDLMEKYVPGWNTYDNNSDTHDVYGHGTAVAGSAAASSNNSAGVASVAWGCKIMPVRISSTSGDGFGSTIAAGLTWAADHGARVANVSYRMDYSSTVTSAAQYFQNHGGVVTMSAGNNSTVYTTGDNPSILVVSATDSTDHLASWSNSGSNIDLSAPGVSILNTNNGAGY